MQSLEENKISMQNAILEVQRLARRLRYPSIKALRVRLIDSVRDAKSCRHDTAPSLDSLNISAIYQIFRYGTVPQLVSLSRPSNGP